MHVPDRSVAARFAAFCAAVVRPIRLPIPPSLVGFALINGTTFAVDLALLTLLRSAAGLPVAVAITIAYLTAFGLSFVLNRWLNFRSHGPVAGQTARYAVAIGLNYLVFILGIGAGLAALGVDYRLSRILAGCGEALFMYCVMRWVVFSDAREGTPAKAATRGQPR